MIAGCKQTDDTQAVRDGDGEDVIYREFENLAYDVKIADLGPALHDARDLDLERRNHEGLRLLDLAAQRNQGLAAAAFVAAGSNIWAVDSHGESVIHIAVRARAFNVLRELRRFVPDVGRRNKDGLTPRDLAIQIGFEDALELLR